MERLLARGVRHFKFVDRTFNLGIATAAILRFFRERWQEGMFLHFELVPDRLPDELRAEIAAFPPGSLQFEVGVQTLDPRGARASAEAGRGPHGRQPALPARTHRRPRARRPDRRAARRGRSRRSRAASTGCGRWGRTRSRSAC
jgi:hypothetical protein